ncbi:MAG: peptide chain release factor N(5)-glutamine methyltransferase [Cyanobacteria bacterium]|nr:peptide chain release factor N(5)-glutamine methyltransferase [Cyanobacteriota bacterium]MDA0867052.1 peptide chain release factor N(5)-glutamine methyltransferase [Cyanobacteriota bacterium]
MSLEQPHFPHQLEGKALWQWRQQALRQAETKGIPPAEVDWLLQGLCQVDRLALSLGTLAEQFAISSAVSFQELQELWQKRVGDRVPVQHLVGATPWRNFTLAVSPAVLIPRPETELLIDLAGALVSDHPQGRQLAQGIWVDMGTGSGAIALGLATAFPEARIIATDISAAALAIAQQNAQANALGDRIEFRQGAWFEPLHDLTGQLAGVVSNPPYIPTEIVSTLQPEVARHEPHLALDGGDDGLDALRHLVTAAPQFLRDGGLWMVEHMAGQAEAVAQLLQAPQTYGAISIHADLAGIDRFVTAQQLGRRLPQENTAWMLK